MIVIVARADDSFSQILREAGIEVINLELIRTEVLQDLSQFENLISRLDEYDGVFFTSPVAAAVFTAHVEPPIRPTLYVLGKRAISVLENAGFQTASAPAANTADDMLRAFAAEEFADKKLLFIRGERSMRTLPETLRESATVDEIAVYETIESVPDGEQAARVRQLLRDGKSIGSICFFSPSSVEAFAKLFGHTDARAAAIGETTASRARDLGFVVELVASRATNETFAKELIKSLEGKEIV